MSFTRRGGRWRIAALCAAVVIVLGVAAVATVVGDERWRAHQDVQDARVCAVMAQFDGKTYRPLVVARMRAAGDGVKTRIGAIARHGDARSWPGHLSLTSEDYDLVDQRCDRLGHRAQFVD